MKMENNYATIFLGLVGVPNLYLLFECYYYLNYSNYSSYFSYFEISEYFDLPHYLYLPVANYLISLKILKTD